MFKVFVALLTRFPPASCTWTLMAGVIAAPAAVFVGSTIKPSFVAAPTVMSKLAEVAVLNPAPLASNVYPLPTLSTEMSLKVASPLTAAAVNVPDKVPLPGLLLMANVIEFVAVTTRFPPASSTWTLMGGLIGEVDTVLVGSTLKTNCAGAPTLISKIAEIAEESPMLHVATV